MLPGWPTQGGKQFWTDHRWWFGNRLQQHSNHSSWRILDARNGLYFAGGEKETRARWDGLVETLPYSTERPLERVVLLVHGLMRTRSSMRSIEAAIHLRNESGSSLGTPISVSYASTRNTISDNAMSIRELIDHLPGQPKISFVGHSLGNILWRRIIGLYSHEGDPHRVLQRITATVMLAPPNNGSAVAKQLSHWWLFQIIAGSAGQELGKDWSTTQSQLCHPPGKVAILIGDLKLANWSVPNPILSGEHDWIVSAEETLLPSADRVLRFPALHSFIMTQNEVIQATLEFLSDSIQLQGTDAKAAD